MKSKILGLLAVALLAGPLASNAAYIVTMEQVGSNVVGTGSGTLLLNGLTPVAGNFFDGRRVGADLGLLVLGAPAHPTGPIDVYDVISGPLDFGTGAIFNADSGSGGLVGLFAPLGRLFVPDGYVSGTDLGTSTATWNNTTFSSLGLTPGQYVWSWGSGDFADSFTLRIIGRATVPEPGTLVLLGLGLLGLGVSRRKA